MKKLPKRFEGRENAYALAKALYVTQNGFRTEGDGQWHPTEKMFDAIPVYLRDIYVKNAENIIMTLEKYDYYVSHYDEIDGG